MKKQPKKIKLSIIILTFNSENELPACLESIYKFDADKLTRQEWELTVIDNHSSDQTISQLRKNLFKYPHLKIIENRENLGFGPANNLAAKKSAGQFVLFLNPDTVVEKNSLSMPLSYLEGHPDVGVATAKLILGNNQVDMTCHRGFPTPWNSLCYFTGLSKVFPTSRFFAGYTLGNLDLNTDSEIDAVTGAYLMMPRLLGEKLNWFDPDFFWKGEDLDLCYRVKAAGYKVMYLPEAIVHHFKGASKGHQKGSKTLAARFEVMRLFYNKHYRNKYPTFIRLLVATGINILEKLANHGIL